MSLFDVLRGSKRIQQRVRAATSTGDWRAMQDRLEDLDRLTLSEAESWQIAAGFLEAYADIAPVVELQSGKMLPRLERLQDAPAGDQEAIDRQERIYASLTLRTCDAADFASAEQYGVSALHWGGLSAPVRETLLARLIRGGCDAPTIFEFIESELTNGTSAEVIAALEHASTCSVSDDENTLSRAVSFADIAVRLQIEEEWAYYNSGLAHFALGDLDAAASAIKAGLETNREFRRLRFVLALVMIQKGRFALAVRALANTEFSRLRELADAADFFCGLDSQQKPAHDRIKAWWQAFGTEWDESEPVGAVLPFVRGRLLARGNQLAHALVQFRQAVDSDPKPLYQYYLIHCHQLIGEWDNAELLLVDADSGSEAIECLRLIQDKRRHTCQAPNEGTRLTSSKYALITGASASPVDTGPHGDGAREFQEEAFRIQLGWAVRSGDANAVFRLAQSPLFFSLPLAEIAFYEGVANWLRRDEEKAETALTRCLKAAPAHSGAAKCLAELRLSKHDHDGAMRLLADIIRRNPSDHRSRVRLALLHDASGERQKALDLLRQDSGSPETSYVLGRLQFADLIESTTRKASQTKPIKTEKPWRRKAEKARSLRTDWGPIERQALRIRGSFEDAQGFRDAAFFVWACELLRSPPNELRANASRLRSARPSIPDDQVSIEILWIDALVNAVSSAFPDAAAACERLADLVVGHNPTASLDVVTAIRFAACDAADDESLIRVMQCVQTLKEHNSKEYSVLGDLLRGLLIHTASRPDGNDAINFAELGLTQDDEVLLKVVKAARENDLQTANELLDDESISQGPYKPYVDLARGICAFSLDSSDTFDYARTTANGSLPDRWKQLSALADAKFGKPTAAASLIGLLRSQRHRAFRDPLPWNGALAFIAGNPDLNSATLLIDELRPANLPKNVDILKGLAQVAASIERLDQFLPKITASAAQETAATDETIQRFRIHAAVRAIDAGDMARALSVLHQPPINEDDGEK